jgi:hypothetical protein
VNETVIAPLAGWESFYVIVGSSAAALTGLQFVVIALINDLHTPRSGDAIGAFGSPTVVHFCIALLTSSVLSAPWRTLASPAFVLGATGLAGLVYAAIVIRRARRQTAYKPVFEDWLFHAILPVLAYGAIIGGGAAMIADATDALFAVAAATLLLVFIGIHNAWDTVTWITFVAKDRQGDGSGAESAPAVEPAPARSESASPPRETERVETR